MSQSVVVEMDHSDIKWVHTRSLSQTQDLIRKTK
jgi:hypothetical protein